MSWLKRMGAILWRAVQGFVADQALSYAAAVAFYTVLSLGPILVLLLWISAGFGEATQQMLVDQLATLLGSEGGEVVRTVIESAETDIDAANLAGWLSIGTLLVSATGVFAQLQVSLNTVWGVRPRTRGYGVAAWLKKRLLSLGLIVSTCFLLLVSLVVSSTLSAVLHSMRSDLPAAAAIGWTLTDLLVPFGIYVLIFMAVFRYIPDAQLRWRHVGYGALVTAALFVLGKYAIGLYLGTSALGSTYGAAGSLALMLVWTYYSSAIVLFGAELTQARVRERGEHIEVEDHAELVKEGPGAATDRATAPDQDEDAQDADEDEEMPARGGFGPEPSGPHGRRRTPSA